MGNSAPPGELFSLLGNDIRVSIMRVLGEASEPVPFTELCERVGMEDTGQFNYHLNRLVGPFIRRDEDNNYELSYGGVRVVGAIYSGEFDDTIVLDPFPLNSYCITCSSQLEGSYRDENVYIRCPNCHDEEEGDWNTRESGLESVETRFWFPQGGIQDRSSEELTHVFDWWLKKLFYLKIVGICDNCAGSMAAWLTDDDEFMAPEDPVSIQFECTRCPEDALMSISSYLYLHPTVSKLLSENSIHFHNLHAWNIRAFFDPSIKVVSKDPWNVEATIYPNQQPFVFQIDGQLRVNYIG